MLLCPQINKLQQKLVPINQLKINQVLSVAVAVVIGIKIVIKI